MAQRTDAFELGGLHLSAGEGRRRELGVVIDPIELAGERYPVSPVPVAVRLDISRTTGDGYALRLRFDASLSGPCMRCLEPAAPTFSVDSREVSQPGEGEELQSDYLVHGVLELASWARDALVLTIPAQLLCRPDCAGLCAVCGVDLNAASPDHLHEAEPDSRWAKLSEIRFD
jgi:uncharacterized protein